jgi:hypothetical protein
VKTTCELKLINICVWDSTSCNLIEVTNIPDWGPTWFSCTFLMAYSKAKLNYQPITIYSHTWIRDNISLPSKCPTSGFSNHKYEGIHWLPHISYIPRPSRKTYKRTNGQTPSPSPRTNYADRLFHILNNILRVVQIKKPILQNFSLPLLLSPY